MSKGTNDLMSNPNIFKNSLQTVIINRNNIDVLKEGHNFIGKAIPVKIRCLE